MHKVNRVSIPESLKENSDTWTKELLHQINTCGGYTKVEEKYKNRYNKVDVKESLAIMYSDMCCYCESAIGIQTYGRIEHFRPKSLEQFHHLAYAWTNLHWSCEICNSSYKKANWDENNQILDPSKDDIEKYLSFDLITAEYSAIKDNQRGINTLNFTGINRRRLVDARKELIIAVFNSYKDYKKWGKETEFLDILNRMPQNSYTTVYLSIINKLLSLNI